MNPRVLKGAGLLNKEKPGWEISIDPLCLDMGDPRLCVLGMLYGLFSIGLSSLFPGESRPLLKAAEYGFYVIPYESFDELTKDWLTYLKEGQQ